MGASASGNDVARSEISSLLRELSEMVGVSGHEGHLGSRIASEYRRFCDEVRSDRLGNCIGLKRSSSPRGRAPRVMLAAHMDEVGLMVTEVDERGFVRISAVDGIDPGIMPGQEVWVCTASGEKLPGAVGFRPPHLLGKGEGRKLAPMRDLFVDLGRPLRGEVRPGDLVAFKRSYAELQGGFASGKSLDDRAGVAALCHCGRLLEGSSHYADVYFAATAAEEAGFKGAIVGAYSVRPDVAVALDVGHGDMPGVPEHRTLEMGKGPAIATGANVHPEVHRKLTEAAREAQISYQVEVAPGRTGTDAWAIQVAREGIPTGLVSIPLRYMHTSVETVCLDDVEAAGRLLCEFVRSIDREFVEGLRWKL